MFIPRLGSNADFRQAFSFAVGAMVASKADFPENNGRLNHPSAAWALCGARASDESLHDVGDVVHFSTCLSP